ncbi:hypothetical protein ACFX1X_031107 [Malus domestica]
MAKSGSPLDKLATIKSNKVDFAAKVVPKYIPLVAETDSPTKKKKPTRVGNFEKYTKPLSRVVAEIYALLKPNLLQDIDVCAKFGDDVKIVVYPSSFAKHTTEYRKTAFLAMM